MGNSYSNIKICKKTSESHRIVILTSKKRYLKFFVKD